MRDLRHLAETSIAQPESSAGYDKHHSAVHSRRIMPPMFKRRIIHGTNPCIDGRIYKFSSKFPTMIRVPIESSNAAPVLPTKQRY